MIKIDEARWLLRRAMETQGPDFVYNPGGRGGCMYQPIETTSASAVGLSDPRTKTGCLIGVALTLYGETRHLAAGGGIAAIAHRQLPGLMSFDVIHYFATAQQAQDRGETWGASFARAEHWLYAERVPLSR